MSLAAAYDESKHDVAGWLLSEKLDGMRCLWDGKGALWSRTGHRVPAPSYILACLPAGTPLDGELFLGRGKFQDCMSIVRRQDMPATWKRIKYVIFDAPTAPGATSARIAAARAALAALPESGRPYAEVLEQTVCRGRDHVREELARIEALKGEGVMLRKDCAHRGGRTTDLLKVKSSHDAEAVVTAHVAGSGKNAGRLGALLCTAKGKAFKVGTGFSDAERDSPPAVGAVITYKYSELTVAGLPRFPAFLRTRPDVHPSAVA